MLLTDRHVSNHCKGFINNSAIRVKLLKPQISKIIQLAAFFDNFLESVLKIGLPLTKNVLRPQAKIVPLLLELTAPASPSEDAGTQRKVCVFGTAKPVISNKQILEIVKSLKESGTF